MAEQVLFSGTTTDLFMEKIISGIMEEVKKIYPQKTENKNQTDEFLTVKEACAFLKCSETKLWRLRKKGSIKDYKNGRGILLKKSELEEYLNNSRA